MPGSRRMRSVRMQRAPPWHRAGFLGAETCGCKSACEFPIRPFCIMYLAWDPTRKSRLLRASGLTDRSVTMGEVVTLELPDHVGRSAWAVAARTHRRVEEVLGAGLIRPRRTCPLNVSRTKKSWACVACRWL